MQEEQEVIEYAGSKKHKFRWNGDEDRYEDQLWEAMQQHKVTEGPELQAYSILKRTP